MLGFDASNLYTCLSLRENVSYLEFFWSVISRIQTKYEEILCNSPCSVRMPENTDQKNSKWGRCSRSAFVVNLYPEKYHSTHYTLLFTSHWFHVCRDQLLVIHSDLKKHNNIADVQYNYLSMFTNVHNAVNVYKQELAPVQSNVCAFRKFLTKNQKVLFWTRLVDHQTVIQMTRKSFEKYSFKREITNKELVLVGDLPAMDALVEKLSNCCDYFSRLSGFPDLFGKEFLVTFKFS